MQAICDAVNWNGEGGLLCDPDTHPSRAELAAWVEQGVASVVGVHPRRTVNDREKLHLGGLLD